MWCPVKSSVREENFPSMYSDLWEMSIGWLLFQVFKKQLSKVCSQAFWVSYRSWTFLSIMQESFAQPTLPCLNDGSCSHSCVTRPMSDQKFLWAEEMWVKSGARLEPPVNHTWCIVKKASFADLIPSINSQSRNYLLPWGTARDTAKQQIIKTKTTHTFLRFDIVFF